MIKFVCDRCHCEVYMTFMPFNREAVLIDGVYRKTYDLCKKCMHEVRMFITEQTVTEIDAVEVVRCRDCKWASPNGKNGCALAPFSPLNDKHYMYANDYCSYGEREAE